MKKEKNGKKKALRIRDKEERWNMKIAKWNTKEEIKIIGCFEKCTSETRQNKNIKNQYMK